jgi:hypothetical protein
MKIGRGIQVISRFASTVLMAVMLALLIEGIDEMRQRDGLRWLDIRTKFHEVWYRH